MASDIMQQLEEINERLKQEPTFDFVLKSVSILLLDGLAIINQNTGIIEWCDEAFTRTIGFSCLGKVIEEIFPPEMRDRHTLYRAQYSENPKIRHFRRLQYPRTDGKLITVDIALLPYLGHILVAVRRYDEQS